MENQVLQRVSRLQIYMKAQLWDPVDPMFNIGLPHAFKRICDNNEVHDAAAIWLIISLQREALKVVAAEFNNYSI